MAWQESAAGPLARQSMVLGGTLDATNGLSSFFFLLSSFSFLLQLSAFGSYGLLRLALMGGALVSPGLPAAMGDGLLPLPATILLTLIVLLASLQG